MRPFLLISSCCFMPSLLSTHPEIFSGSQTFVPFALMVCVLGILLFSALWGGLVFAMAKKFQTLTQYVVVAVALISLEVGPSSLLNREHTSTTRVTWLGTGKESSSPGVPCPSEAAVPNLVPDSLWSVVLWQSDTYPQPLFALLIFTGRLRKDIKYHCIPSKKK